MLKISYAGCLGLSLAISAQFTLKMQSAIPYGLHPFVSVRNA